MLCLAILLITLASATASSCPATADTCPKTPEIYGGHHARALQSCGSGEWACNTCGGCCPSNCRSCNCNDCTGCSGGGSSSSSSSSTSANVGVYFGIFIPLIVIGATISCYRRRQCCWAGVPGGPNMAPPAMLYAAPAGPTSLVQFKVEQEGAFFYLRPNALSDPRAPHTTPTPPPLLCKITGSLGLDLGFVAAGQGGAPAGWRV